MIEKMPRHYSMTNPASVYDEEALTALELAGRTAAKVNEIIGDQNDLREETTKTIEDQNKRIEEVKKETLSEQQINDAVNQIESMVFVGGEKIVQFLQPDTETGAMSILFPSGASIKYRIGGKAGELVPTGEALSGLAQSVYTITSSGTTITIPAYTALVLDRGEPWTLALRANSDLESEDIVLAQNSFFEFVGGKLIDHYTIHTLKEIDYQPTAFLGNKQILNVTPKGDNSGYMIDFPCRISVINDKSIAIEWSSVGSELGSKLTVNGNTATLDLLNHSSLVYNTVEGLLHLRASGTIQRGDVVLIQSAWMNLIGGALLTEWSLKKIDELKDSSGGSGGSGSPVVQSNTAKEFSRILASRPKDSVAFLFFTDPHLFTGDGYETEFKRYMDELQNVVETCPIDFVVCGGDWLNAHTKNEAKDALAYAFAQCKARFPKFYPINGNHDTNYQGVNESWSDEPGSGLLTKTEMENLMFRDTPWEENPYGVDGKSFYRFTVGNYRFWVFDTGIDGRTTLDYSDKNQLKWFFNKCNGNYDFVPKREIILMHTVNDAGKMHPIYNEISAMITGANEGWYEFLTEIDENGEWVGAAFQFEDSGIRRPSCVIGGHAHEDRIIEESAYDSENVLPWVTTTNLQANGKATFDLIIVDDNNVTLHRPTENGITTRSLYIGTNWTFE